MKNNKIKISIVIPVYKDEEYLEACLDSLLSQSLKDIEIICVNDGSPDRCAEILASYKDRDSRVIVITQENGGLSIARNSGLKEARGEYVYFLDSDDYLAEDDALSKMYEAAESDGIDILSFNHRTIGLEEKVYQRPIALEEVMRGSEYLQKTGMWSVMVWLRLYKRSYLESINFAFVPKIASEDDEALVRLYFSADRVKHIEDVLLVYRRRENSISTSTTSPRLIDGLLAVVRAYNALSKQTEDAKFKRYLYNKLLEYLFILYEKTLLSEDIESADKKYRVLIVELGWTPLQKRLMENEERFIAYHQVEKKTKKYDLSIYYLRRFRILYYRYVYNY